MRRKLAIVTAVFALMFSTTGGASSAEGDARTGHDAITAMTGITSMSVQGTAWVPERPNRFDLFKHWAWGTRTSTKKPTQEWVHIAIPMPEVIDSTAHEVFYVQFCAKAWKPSKSAPVAVHIWNDTERVHTEAIDWPDTTDHHCHAIVFNPPEPMTTVGVSVLVNYANRRHRVELDRALIQMAPSS